ncbi:MAG: redoxin domain-containing protein, partial [Acidimicrobiia bacterium]|nr:redoxin domain-containing protein [Acidimicrobiia bacterium]
MAPTAPPIDGQAWINSEPLISSELRGGVVVLVFWAASCESSLRQVQRVQDLVSGLRSADDGGDPSVAAIAVHSPRMPIDDEINRLEHIVARHRITIPVVHDPRFETWNRYEPPGWPSTAVIDGNGRVTGVVAGCHDDEGLLETAIGAALTAPRGRRRTDRPPRPVGPTDSDAARRADTNTRRGLASALRHPESLARCQDDSFNRRLAVADTGNDRILIGRLDATHRGFLVESQVVGLNQPSNVIFVDEGRRLAVVERGLNAVSIIDPTSGRRTVVTTRLVRPTGITVDLDGSLVICDAGGDRLYRAVANSTGSGYMVDSIAGSGRTGTSAGDAPAATLAQPSAVVRASAGLVFSDAASSNLRLLTDGGEVVNITDGDLFGWGLVDGLAHRARLQRPSGLCRFDDGS